MIKPCEMNVVFDAIQTGDPGGLTRCAPTRSGSSRQVGDVVVCRALPKLRSMDVSGPLAAEGC